LSGLSKRRRNLGYVGWWGAKTWIWDLGFKDAEIKSGETEEAVIQCEIFQVLGD
jgi:hypothetical protein